MNKKPINRRKFVKLGISSALATATFHPLSALASKVSKSKSGTSTSPNILFISVDDLNDFISPLGGYKGKIHTPNFDRLAKMGVTFEKAFCTAPVCGSSRSSIMTGLSPARTKLMNQENIFQVLEDPDSHDAFAAAYDNGNNFTVKSLSQAVKDIKDVNDKSLYSTFGTGKLLHQAGFYSSNDFVNCKSYYDSQSDYEKERTYYDPNSWDEYQVLDFAMPPQNPGENPLTDYKKPYSRYFADGVVIDSDELCKGQNFKYHVGSAYDGNEHRMVDQKNVDFCVDKLNNYTTKPMFLACGLYRPHVGWLVPQKYYDMYPKEDILIPDYNAEEVIWSKLPHIAKHSARKGVLGNFREDNDPNESLSSLWQGHAADLYQGYLASVSFADDMLGQLLDAVENRNATIGDKTIIMLWSDHGWDLGDKLGWRKSKLWDVSARIPFFIADPDGQQGKRCKRVVSSLDIYPTVMDYVTNGNFNNQCGSHTCVDGNSIRALVNNPEKVWNYGAVTSFGIKINHTHEVCLPNNQIDVTSHCEPGESSTYYYDPNNKFSYSHSIRTNRWRYILHDPNAYPNNDELHEELYDHYSDPKERRNLLYESSDREKHEHIRAMFNKILSSHLGLAS